MKTILLIISIAFSVSTVFASEEMIPYQFTDQERDQGLPAYDIPASSRFTTKRADIHAPEIVYYFSTPKTRPFPIAIVCGGSSSKEDISSIIHVHRYFLKEFLALGAAVLSVEQWGVDGNQVDSPAFMAHYTRMMRLQDHEAVIEHLKKNPPKGWNGKLIFLGASEGGPIVTTLSTKYSNRIIATINWSGAGDWSWREELWLFLKNIKSHAPWYIKLQALIPQGFPLYLDFPKTRQEYDAILDQTLENPDPNKLFMGMTYQYHADALRYPVPDYQKIRTPFLVVTGAQDTIVQSSDAFVEKARKAGAPITYLRISDMDHYVRKRSDVVQQSFEWLKQQIKSGDGRLHDE